MQGFSLIAGVNLQYICCSGITQYGEVVKDKMLSQQLDGDFPMGQVGVFVSMVQ